MQIILNGRLTDGIPLQRGVRQGNPLSPLLNVLWVEALANQIRNCTEIRGFLLPGAHGKQAKVRLYADDTTAILKDCFLLRKLFDLVSVYEHGSGAKLNRSKTEAMWARFVAGSPRWTPWSHVGTVPVETDNWQPKLEKLEKSLNLWKSRSLSFVGRALMVNVLRLVSFSFLAIFLLCPPRFSHVLISFVWGFIWGSRIETVGRNALSLSSRFGGLAFVILSLSGMHFYDL